MPVKKKRGRPRKTKVVKPEIDPKIQHGIITRYRQPCTVCPECGKPGAQENTAPYHELQAIERFFRCENNHQWVEFRRMGK